MKIQSLAIIFVIIILPISIILSEYVHAQTNTLSIQTSYDSKLLGATYDAVMSFQKNTVNSSTSDITQSKMRDIEAAATTFLNSVASNFGLNGYSKETIQTYVPALVFVLYDGYYIYSRYENTLNSERSDGISVADGKTYQDKQQLTGIKPYIYYSREYTPNPNSKFVITYSLDNYIEIQGIINGEAVNEHGYIIDINHTTYDNNRNVVTNYRGFEISEAETLTEYIDSNGEKKDDGNYVIYNQLGKNIYKYVKVNGVKYYLHENYDGPDRHRVFSFLKNEREYLSEQSSNIFINAHPFKDTSARDFYTEAYNFTKKVVNEYGLNKLTSSDSPNLVLDGRDVQTYSSNEKIKIGGQANYNIFKDLTDVEYYNSEFNQERRAVIRDSIEKNLRIAIANYNNYSGSTNNFQMPNLKEDEWDKVINNVCIISFLQGMQAGTKTYNGYAIVPNKKNEEFVAEDSIYITTNDGEYHRVTDQDLLTTSVTNLKSGEFNMNFERKSKNNEDGQSMRMYYPQIETGCYYSIVTQERVNELVYKRGIKQGEPQTIYEYLNEKNNSKLGSLYLTALGRERKSIYRVINPVETYSN